MSEEEGNGDDKRGGWGNTPAARKDNHVVNEVRVLCVLPKNKSSEQRVTVKDHQTRSSKIMQRFVDIREHWFKFGPLEEPIATGKGTMIHREHVPKLILGLIGDMQPEEFLPEELERLKTQIARLEKRIGG